jgi:hypothetical protein
MILLRKLRITVLWPSGEYRLRPRTGSSEIDQTVTDVRESEYMCIHTVTVTVTDMLSFSC